MGIYVKVEFKEQSNCSVQEYKNIVMETSLDEGKIMFQVMTLRNCHINKLAEFKKLITNKRSSQKKHDGGIYANLCTVIFSYK